MRSFSAAAAALLATATSLPARGATIHITPADTYDKIEAAGPGDEVVIAPGKYGFRLRFSKQAPADKPIVIRAEDPKSPPVWDFTGTLVEDAPGGPPTGDEGRGAWQFVGAANYHVDGIVIQGATSMQGAASAIRNIGGTTGLTIKNCVFRNNDIGVQGMAQGGDTTVEFSEFDHNGGSDQVHNMYIHGGSYTLRYSYVHDAVAGQNFHIAAEKSVLEYNFIARGGDYEGDLSANTSYPSQSMLLRGNVFVQGANQSTAKIVAFLNYVTATAQKLSIEAVNNTFVVVDPNTPVFHVYGDPMFPISATLSVTNSLVVGAKAMMALDAPAMAKVSGSNNLLPTGADPGPLTASVFGDPKFKDMGKFDLTLSPGSPAIGAADDKAMDLPDKEYFRDEVIARMYRVRATAHDIGAFESTTMGPGIGPYDTPTTGSSSSAGSGSGSTAASGAGSGAGGAGSAGSGGGSSGGCGCRAAERGGAPGWAPLGIVALSLLGRRRRGPPRRDFC